MFKQLKLAGSMAALALATAAVPATAATSAFPQSEFNAMFWSADMFKTMDANRDGMLSRDEYLTYMGRQFDRMDAGKKKMLTSAQFTDKAMMAQTFTRSAGE